MPDTKRRPFTAEKRLYQQAAGDGAPPSGRMVDHSGISNGDIITAIEGLRGDLKTLVRAAFSEAAPEIKEELAPPPPPAPVGPTPEEVEKLQVELNAMARNIQETKSEIVSLRPANSEHDHLVIVSDQLDAVVEATENATDSILNAAEKIDALGQRLSAHVDEEDRQLVDEISENVIAIFEASNFQDLTGQRITKVVNTLKFVEERINSMIDIWGADTLENVKPKAEFDEDLDGDQALLNGPQLKNEGISQNDIDALFD